MQQLETEVIIKKRSRLTLPFDLWPVSKNHRSVNLDSLRVTAVRPTSSKRIEPTLREPHFP